MSWETHYCVEHMVMDSVTGQVTCGGLRGCGRELTLPIKCDDCADDGWQHHYCRDASGFIYDSDMNRCDCSQAAHPAVVTPVPSEQVEAEGAPPAPSASPLEVAHWIVNGGDAA